MGSDVMGARPKDEEEDSVWCCVKWKGAGLWRCVVMLCELKVCWNIMLCCFVWRQVGLGWVVLCFAV